MDKIDIRDMILRTFKENKIEVDNFNDAVFEDDFLKVAETIVKNLPIYVVMQQRELLVAFLEMLENTPQVEIPLSVGMVAVDQFLATNCA